MDDSVLISVITINRNNLEGLKKTMSSVFSQSFSNFEYLVIDGASTDGSSEYIFDCQNKLSYWCSEPDAGIYQAMNKGILKAKGQFLLFLNSGDWLASENILETVSIHLPGIDVLYGNMIKVFPSRVPVIDKGPEGSPISLNIFFKGTLNHCSSFISKNLFEKFGFYDENLQIVSDWKFYLIALGLNNSKVKYIDLSVSYFDMTGISNYNKILREEERKKVLIETLPFPIYKDYLELENLSSEINSKDFRRYKEIQNVRIIRKLISLLSKIYR